MGRIIKKIGIGLLTVFLVIGIFKNLGVKNVEAEDEVTIKISECPHDDNRRLPLKASDYGCDTIILDIDVYDEYGLPETIEADKVIITSDENLGGKKYYEKATFSIKGDVVIKSGSDVGWMECKIEGQLEIEDGTTIVGAIYAKNIYVLGDCTFKSIINQSESYYVSKSLNADDVISLKKGIVKGANANAKKLLCSADEMNQCSLNAEEIEITKGNHQSVGLGAKDINIRDAIINDGSLNYYGNKYYPINISITNGELISSSCKIDFRNFGNISINNGKLKFSDSKLDYKYTFDSISCSDGEIINMPSYFSVKNDCSLINTQITYTWDFKVNSNDVPIEAENFYIENTSFPFEKINSRNKITCKSFDKKINNYYTEWGCKEVRLIDANFTGSTFIIKASDSANVKGGNNKNLIIDSPVTVFDNATIGSFKRDGNDGKSEVTVINGGSVLASVLKNADIYVKGGTLSVSDRIENSTVTVDGGSLNVESNDKSDKKGIFDSTVTLKSGNLKVVGMIYNCSLTLDGGTSDIGYYGANYITDSSVTINGGKNDIFSTLSNNVININDGDTVFLTNLYNYSQKYDDYASMNREFNVKGGNVTFKGVCIKADKINISGGHVREMLGLYWIGINKWGRFLVGGDINITGGVVEAVSTKYYNNDPIELIIGSKISIASDMSVSQHSWVNVEKNVISIGKYNMREGQGLIQKDMPEGGYVLLQIAKADPKKEDSSVPADSDIPKIDGVVHGDLATGLWVEKPDGTYPVSQWGIVNGKKYYFDKRGYAAANEYANGKWFNADGTVDEKYSMEWKSNATGWWIEDKSGWYPVNKWLKIDGYYYFFTAEGYMDYSEYRDGCWLGSDGAWVEEYYGGHWCSDSKGWWYEDSSGWYPCSQYVWIDGVNYWFGASGYWE